MSVPRNPARRPGPLSSPTVVGAILLMIAAIGVVLSYNASRGLPYVPTYDVVANVPDAAELIAGGSDVRVGGARVGIVDDVRAMPAIRARPAYARLKLKLDQDQAELPADTHVQVRPRSVLGAKYLDLQPGHSARTVAPGGTIPLRNARAIVEFDEAFDVFDDRTSRGLRGAVSELGAAVAGRGADVNELVGTVARGLPAVQRVLHTVASPQADLRGFVRGAARAADALAPASPALGGFVDGAAQTLAAFDAAGGALPRALAELPPTESVSTRALQRVTPVLRDASSLAAALRPGTRALPRTSRQLARTLDTAMPVLARTPAFADRLGEALRVLGRVARDPDAGGAVRQLLATVTSVRTTLGTLEPAQVFCNIGGEWATNYGAAFGDANSLGHFLNGQLVIDPTQMVASAQPAANLHTNPTPHENADECEAGNEPYGRGRAIGSPAGLQRRGDRRTTRPPAQSVRLARGAGLLTPIPGAAR